MMIEHIAQKDMVKQVKNLLDRVNKECKEDTKEASNMRKKMSGHSDNSPCSDISIEIDFVT